MTFSRSFAILCLAGIMSTPSFCSFNPADDPAYKSASGLLAKTKADEKQLSLMGFRLSALPPEIFAFHKVTSLDLADNCLIELPEEVLKMKSLRWLLLEGNRLSSIPSKIYLLENLTVLNLRNNQFSQLPLEIGFLFSLEALDVGQNLLSTLPPQMNRLKKLKTLDISSNRFETFPEVVVELFALKALYASNNQLSWLPIGLGFRADLEQLDLSHNHLTGIPEIVVLCLPHLRMFNLMDNQITALPKGMSNMHSLRALYIQGNQIAELPSDFAKLVNVTLSHQNADARNVWQFLLLERKIPSKL